MALEFLKTLLVRSADREGRAEALESEVLATPEAVLPEPGAPDAALAEPAAEAGREQRLDPEGLVLDAVASKLLASWLANRHQTLVPHTLNFATLDPEHATTLIGIMAAAAQADGAVDAVERQQVGQALERMWAPPPRRKMTL